MVHCSKQRKPERRIFAIEWVEKGAVGANALMGLR